MNNSLPSNPAPEVFDVSVSVELASALESLAVLDVSADDGAELEVVMEALVCVFEPAPLDVPSPEAVSELAALDVVVLEGPVVVDGLDELTVPPVEGAVKLWESEVDTVEVDTVVVVSFVPSVVGAGPVPDSPQAVAAAISSSKRGGWKPAATRRALFREARVKPVGVESKVLAADAEG